MHLRPAWAKKKKEGKRQGKEGRRKEGRKKEKRKRDRKKDKRIWGRISLKRAKTQKEGSVTALWDSRMSLKGEPLKTEVAYCEQSVRTSGE